MRRSPQVLPRVVVDKPRIVIDLRFFQDLHELLAERAFPMMRFLFADVFCDRIPTAGADSEGGIAILPLKLPELEFVFDPE